MKCHNCGGEFQERKGSLDLPSKILGEFRVEDVHYFKCDQCPEIMLPEETWKAVDLEEERQIKNILTDLPLKKFIGAPRTAEILGMSRQALHKHRRIRRGFIHFVTHEGRTYYHIDSVRLFKETGDGRFPLRRKAPERGQRYIVNSRSSYPAERKSYRDISERLKPAQWLTSQTLPRPTGRFYEQ